MVNSETKEDIEDLEALPAKITFERIKLIAKGKGITRLSNITLSL